MCAYGKPYPTRCFDDADEVVLVDIPADELLETLESRQVYVPLQAERAANNFFRKGNLMPCASWRCGGLRIGSRGTFRPIASTSR